MGCSQSRYRTLVNVRDLEGMVQTGDIFLFSSKHAGAKVTKFFTASTWDHIGMVVRFPSNAGHQVFILEYAGGVYLYPLFTRLYTYYAIQGRLIALRRLMPGVCRDEMQRDLQHYVRGLLGQKPVRTPSATIEPQPHATCACPPAPKVGLSLPASAFAARSPRSPRWWSPCSSRRRSSAVSSPSCAARRTTR